MNTLVFVSVHTNGGDNDRELTPRQAEILDAAVRVFSKKGYDGSRTKEIAKEAGISEATLFKHFPTKRALLSAVMRPFIETVMKPIMMASVRQLIAGSKGASLQTVLMEIMHDRVTLVRKRAPLIITMLTEAIRHPDLFVVVREQVVPEITEMLDLIFEPARRNGEIRDLDAKLLGRTLMSLVIGYLVMGDLFPDHFRRGNDDEEIHDMLDVFLHGIVAPEARKQ